jgi:hypothetical protein
MDRPTGDAATAILDEHLAQFDAPVAELARAGRRVIEARYPGLQTLIYDNYLALVIGFSTTSETRDGILSLVLYPRWVNLTFLWGSRLDDPHHLLRGSGARVRTIKLTAAEGLDDPAILALMDAAVATADPPRNPGLGQSLTIMGRGGPQRARKPKPPPDAWHAVPE